MSKLNQFPSTGWCKSLDERLIKFINNKYPNYQKNPIKGDTAICWNKTGFWFVKTFSDNPLYEFEQLEPFLEQKKYEVVHCTTQEEWDFVCDRLKRAWAKDDFVKKDYTCMSISYSGWHTLDHFQKQNCKILSFSEFCTKFNDQFVPKKEYQVGKWYKLSSGKIWMDKPWYIKYKEYINGLHTAECFINDDNEYKEPKSSNFGRTGDYTFALLTDLFEIQEYLPINHPDKFVQNNSQVDLLEIAKKKYPIGTKIYSALKNDNNPCQITVKNHSLDIVDGRTVIWAGVIGFIYDDGKWAEIIEEETLLEKAKRLYPVGTKFKNIYGKPSENVVSEMDHDFESVNIIPDNITVSVKYPDECLKWSIYSKEEGWAEILPQSKNEERIQKFLEKQNIIKQKVSTKPQLIQVKQLQILN